MGGSLADPIDQQPIRYPVEVKPREWLMADRSGFLEWIAGTFVYKQQQELFVQQRFVRDYLQPDSPYRGLVLFHGLGVGKTCAAIAATEVLRQNGRAVIVMAPASLRRNFIEQLKTCGSSSSDADLGRRPRTYTFLNYNGMTRERAASLCSSDDGNVFDNKVVVIDEAHNFMSRVMNGGLLAPVYQRIMDSASCKVVLLSGTPLINNPHEVSYLVNLAHGYLRTVEVTTVAGVTDEATLRSGLEAIPGVDRVSISPDMRTVRVLLLPHGFLRSSKNVGFVVARHATDDDDDGGGGKDDDTKVIVRKVRAVVERHGRVRRAALANRLLLPVEREVFDAKYVRQSDEKDARDIVNREHLERRVTGSVSFFMAYDPQLYPRVSPTRVVALPMSPRQFAEYSLKRDEERKREETAKRIARSRGRSAAASDDQVAQTYRAYSRSICNFVFPESVPRPYRSDIKRMLDEEQDAETGYRETGHRETGHRETGHRETGHHETGHHETGHHETGHRETGHHETGHRETGHRETGHRETKADKVYQQQLQRAIEAVAERTDALLLGSYDTPSPQTTQSRGPSTQTTQSRGPSTQTTQSRGPSTQSQKTQTSQVGTLELHSPKFARIIRHLNERRLMSVVYSAFRKAEGVGLLAAAMRANGWRELVLTREDNEPVFEAHSSKSVSTFITYDNSDEELGQLSLRAFNSEWDKLPPRCLASLKRLSNIEDDADLDNTRGQLIQTLLLTPSGSEGLNLRNVREVHIMEPFWHLNRIDQVIGRAVRARSHAQLPMEERRVDIYMYVMRLTERQIQDNATIKLKDGGLSSDQFVQEVARKKKRVIEAVLEIMRNAAVDCRMHAAAHGRRQCSTVGSRLPRGRALFGVSPDSDDDDDTVDGDGDDSNDHGRKYTRVRYQERPMLLDEATGALYDEERFQATGELVQIGRTVPNTLHRTQRME